MADTDSHRIRLVMDHLIAEQYLGLEGDEYPVLVLRPRYKEVFGEEKTLMMMLPKEKKERSEDALYNTREPQEGPPYGIDAGRRGERGEETPSRVLSRGGKKTRTGAAAAGGEDFQPDGTEEALFLKLKELRNRLAREIKSPAYIVFSDASLREMCRQRPLSPEQFLNVAGVGAVKLEKYGEVFMAAIREHGDESQT
jgi:ATP-dependent DNA helicase RecQ